LVIPPQRARETGVLEAVPRLSEPCGGRMGIEPAAVYTVSQPVHAPGFAGVTDLLARGCIKTLVNQSYTRVLTELPG
jgi:hypothetical protein